MIVVNLDVMMAKRKMTLSQLSEKVDLTLANLSILKNNKAKAVRFSTLPLSAPPSTASLGISWNLYLMRIPLDTGGSGFCIRCLCMADSLNRRIAR